MSELSIYRKEETAHEWLRRVQRNKRKISLNPIVFPHLRVPSDSQTTKQCNGIGDHSLPSQFNVTDQNVINISAQTFQCRLGKLNELNCRSQRWRRRRRKTNVNATMERLTNLEDLLLESFPRGTGINFIDRILTTKAYANAYANANANANANTNPKNSNDIALEIIGRTGTAKTKLLMTLAANYAAATSTACIRLEVANTETSMDKTGPDHLDNDKDGPPIVIFDPEHAIDSDELVELVRVAILRRWNATNEFRQCLANTQTQQQLNPYQNDESGDEYVDIEHDIQCALGRIHIVRPKDIANGYVSALESLNQVLDRHTIVDEGKDVIKKEITSPPVMLLLDSALSAFQLTNKMQENLPNGSGLSGLNDFMRQLRRLRSKHSTFLVSTRTVTGKGDTINQFRTSCDGWDKITTHRFMVMKTVLGSPEERDGHDFVALLKPQYDFRSGKFTDQRVQQIFPFSFTSTGISCKKNV
jgi:hypothetical protein